MGFLDTGGFNEAGRTRVVAKCIRLCEVVAVDGYVTKTDPVRDVDKVTIKLLEPAEDKDGEPLPVGFPVEAHLGKYVDTAGEEKRETANRMTAERIRELVVAAFDLPAGEKDPFEKMKEYGGKSALIGKRVLVAFSVGKTGMQNVDEFLKPAVAQK